MPSKVTDARALMLHQLGEMLYIERAQSEEVLPKLAKEAHDERFRDGLERHLEQTKDQASKIEKAFELLGEKPGTEPSHELDGLRKSHDQLATRIEPDEVRDLFGAEAAAKTEHLEIAGYRGLITMAEQLGEREVAELLGDVCRQEEQMLERLEEVSRDLSRTAAQA